jgi:Caspase domain/Protein of unknown function (DUF1566)
MTNHFGFSMPNLSSLFKLLCGQMRKLALSMSLALVGCFLLANPAALAQTDPRNASVIELASKTQANNGRRVALLIGNSSYSKLKKLANPKNDVRLMEETLRKLGFNEIIGGTQSGLDLQSGDMLELLDTFSKRAIGAEVAVIFFAGHGVMTKAASEQFLAGVEATAVESRLPSEALSINTIMDKLATTGAQQSFVFLDACRETARGGGLRSITLKRDAPNTVIFYATAADDVASDGVGSNSPFTSALSAEIQIPNQEWATTQRGVINRVLTATQEQQEPKPYGSLRNPMYFRVVVESGPGKVEDTFWQSIKTSTDVADYEAYLNQYPNGGFKPLAQNAIKRLQTKPASAVVAVTQVATPVIISTPISSATNKPTSILAPLQTPSSFTHQAANIKLLEIASNIVVGENRFVTVEASLTVTKVTFQLGSEAPFTLNGGGSGSSSQSFRAQVPFKTPGAAVPYTITGYNVQGQAIGNKVTGTVPVKAAEDALTAANPIPSEINKGQTVSWHFPTRGSPAEMWLEFTAPINRLNLTGNILGHDFNYPEGNYSYRLMRKDYLGNVFAIGGASGTLKINYVEVAPQTPQFPQRPRPLLIDGRYQVLGDDSEILDTQTRLIWQRCSVGQYWNGKTCSFEAQRFTFDHAQKQAGQINGKSWRVPTVRELHSLVWCSNGKTIGKADTKDGQGDIEHHCAGDPGKDYISPTIRGAVFPDTLSTWFWTSTPYASGSGLAWVVYFDLGNVNYHYRSDERYVRLVRASQ